MLTKFCSILRLEILSHWRGQLFGLSGLLFFLVSVVFFPLAIGSNPELLQSIGPGYIWMMAMFASLITVDSIFKTDQQFGFLDKCLSQSHILFYYGYSKIIVHWLSSGLPLVCITMLLGIFYYLTWSTLLTLMISLFIGTFIISVFTVFAAVLTLSVSQRSLLIPILIIPLMVPICILGTLATYNSMLLLSPIADLCFMLAILLVSSLALPLASIYLLRYGSN